MTTASDGAATRRTALYRSFDGAGRLLYIGISFDVAVRGGQHRTAGVWWDDTATISVEWFGARAEAESAEKAAIIAEAPIHNSVHTGRHAEAIRASHTTRSYEKRVPMGYDAAWALTNRLRVLRGRDPHPYGWKAGDPS